MSAIANRFLTEEGFLTKIKLAKQHALGGGAWTVENVPVDYKVFKKL